MLLFFHYVFSFCDDIVLYFSIFVGFYSMIHVRRSFISLGFTCSYRSRSIFLFWAYPPLFGVQFFLIFSNFVIIWNRLGIVLCLSYCFKLRIFSKKLLQRRLRFPPVFLAFILRFSVSTWVPFFFVVFRTSLCTFLFLFLYFVLFRRLFIIASCSLESNILVYILVLGLLSM